LSATDTRERLIAGTLETVKEHGVAGVSARMVATRSGANQALVFYHFGSVDNLLAEACRTETARRVAAYKDKFEAVTTLRELLDVGRTLHSAERASRSIAVLAQLIAASHANPTLREAVADGLGLWTVEVEAVLRRVLATSPIDGLLDPAALARAVSAGFIGLELFELVDAHAAEDAFAELERLSKIAEAIDDLGPIARRAVRAKLGRLAYNRSGKLRKDS
jgi:AcrR family transcriptional regulator